MPFKEDQSTPAIWFELDIQGKAIGYFTEVTGLSAEVETMKYSEGGMNEFQHTLPTRVKYPNLVLKRGMTTKADLQKWFQKSHTQAERTTISLTMLDQGGETIRTWSFVNAFPIKWTGPNFNAGQNQLAVERARMLYRFLVENRAGTEDWWGGLLENQVPALANASVSKLVHDDLSEFWDPVWFADFAAHAASHRLAYVGDGNLARLIPGQMPDSVEADMRGLAGDDRIAYEQLYDLVRGIFFRKSILCRDSRQPAAGPSAESMTSLHFAARGNEELPQGLAGAAVDLLRSHAPGTVAFAELRSALGADSDALGEALLGAFDGELVMPHRMPVRAYRVAEVERPVASPLARWQAQRGPEITSLAYRTVVMEEPAARLLITLLDGTRDRAAVRAEFTERTGVRLSADDLEANLEQLARIFVLG